VPTSRADVAHFLRRTGFGGNTAEVDALAPLDRAALVVAATVIRQTEADPPPELYDPALEDSEWLRFVALQAWWFDRMVGSSFANASAPSPVVERMAMFWHNHFATSGEKAYDSRALYAQNALFRREGLGNFRSLVQQMARQPAMLMYLDNESNTKGSPNQNFGRELMELFMFGVGNYTEADVITSAAAWSGHGLDYDENWRHPWYAFHEEEHDTEVRTFLGKTQVWDGPDIIDWILDNPASGPIAAKFIVTKLWTWLVYPKPEAAVVDALATVFRNGGWEIAPLVQAMFMRDEFWSAKAKNGLMRTPVEYSVAAAKSIGLTAARVHPEWTLEGMGQQPFYPPNVSGWRVNDYWISTSAMAARANFAQVATWVTYGTEDPADVNFLCDITGEAAEGEAWVWYGDRVPTAQVIPAVLERFGIVEPTPQTIAQLTAWHTHYRTPGPDEWPWGERAHLIQLVLLSAEFQMA